MAEKSAVPVRSSSAPAERDPFVALRREMNALFDNFFGGAVAGSTAFIPRVDVKETDGEIRVTAELPGMTEKDIAISVDGGVLTIKGEKKEEKEEKGEESYRMERSYGSFRRSLPLPCEVNADKAAATYHQGVLSIALPKAAEAKKKPIAVKAA